MDRLASALSVTGLVGATSRLVSDPSVSREMFSNAGAGVGIVVFFVLLLLVFGVMFLYSVYKIMPNNKAMHLVLTIFVGALWFVPALFYHAYKGYSLRK